jgi:hypothetical protein
MKAGVAEDLRRIFNASNRPMAEAYQAETIKRYEEVAPRLAN